MPRKSLPFQQRSRRSSGRSTRSGWLLLFLLCLLLTSAVAEYRHAQAHRRRPRARGPAAAPHSGQASVAPFRTAAEHNARYNASGGAGLDVLGDANAENLFSEQWEEVEDEPDLPRQLCHGGEQVPELTGEWVEHPDANYSGLYDPLEHCPGFAMDFTCARPYEPAAANPELHAREFRQVFRAHQCELRPWDAAGFAGCLAGRRLVMVGDSLMRQSFQSLGCLAAPVTARGVSADWRGKDPVPAPSTDPDADEPDSDDPAEEAVVVEPPTERRAYGVRADDGTIINATADWFGNFTLTNGAQVHIRNFGYFHPQLWDDMLADLQPLTESDVLMVNFGAWYGRCAWNARMYGLWERWKRDVNELFYQRLVDVKARVIWKSYSPTRFGGVTGTFSMVEEQLAGDPRVPPRTRCEPASVGEFWYDDYVKDLLRECGPRCSHISFLPIFDLSLGRPDSHHGSFGRGKGDDRVTDCRHFCNNVVDVWNVVLYNFMCFK